jgi:hypothetical protein
MRPNGQALLGSRGIFEPVAMAAMNKAKPSPVRFATTALECIVSGPVGRVIFAVGCVLVTRLRRLASIRCRGMLSPACSEVKSTE